MSELGKFYRESQADTGLLLVALQDQQSNVEAFMTQSQTTDLPVLLDPDGTIAGSFGVSAVPTAVIIDKEGKISETKVGLTTAADLQAATDALR